MLRDRKIFREWRGRQGGGKEGERERAGRRPCCRPSRDREGARERPIERDRDI